MRLLVFCDGPSDVLRFADANDGWLILTRASWADREPVLRQFEADPSAKMAVDKFVVTAGWNAPDQTMPLFDRSWHHAPDSPHTRQALSRVDRARHRAIARDFNLIPRPEFKI